MKNSTLGFMSFGLAALMLSATAFATPADVVCTGKTATGQSIEILLGYDSLESSGAAFAEAKIDGVKLATNFKDLQGEYVNVGPAGTEFMNWVQKTTDGINSISLRYPEQDPEGDATAAYLTLVVPSAKIDIKDAEVACQ